ncbi:Hemicentin-1 like protein [Argiope bruennichi]|uniref:Hemicentin-1 like protein n=1 Tax=Argiope bruennichi TaxID=94029 RepID=A0A8T0FR98_ARGBR|nr:Hemicentin-1 like protein [Argiope bruennichi]
MDSSLSPGMCFIFWIIAMMRTVFYRVFLVFLLLVSSEGAIAASTYYDFTEGCCSGQVMLGDSRDVVEGETLRLPCRFHSALGSSTTLYFWSRVNKDGKDNAAINAAALDPHYNIDFSPQEGKYDLLISKANYDKDNGKFECWLKEGGSGVDIYSVSYVVTVLIPPGEPRITPPKPIAREGESAALTCSSEGGSPDPTIRWYRDGVLLQGVIQKGGSRERPTSSILTITPRLEDDDAIYRCVVWNRALREDLKLETSVSLRVHYAPRLTVGPSNPLNVLENTDAHLTCSVIASPPVRTIRWVKNGQLLSNTHNHTIRNVKADDSGIYSCIADNGIGEPTQANLELSVLYGPQVKVVSYQEAKAGEPLIVKCEVNSKPPPHMIQWLKEGDPYFRQTGDTLRIEKITVDDGGRYICQAATSFRPSGSNVQSEAIGNGTVTVRIRHKPGQAEIYPVQPVAIAGRPFTLSCTAHPLGWPLPEYRWWKEGTSTEDITTKSNYTLVSAHMSHEGRYFCQPRNLVGNGGSASVYLTVHEPPSIIIPLRPQTIKKDKERDYAITCRSRGKPKPKVRWLQNGQPISEDSGLFHISTSEVVEDNNAFMVQSTLAFSGPSRRENGLTPGDRGRYTCEFDNGVGEVARSEMMLRIEHSPVVRHTYNRVAFDVGETAVIQCKMQAYPAPQFEWSSRGRVLDEYGNYGTNITDLGEDIYAGVLSIRDMKEEDYGEYTCRASNQVGDDKKTIIRLVRKGPPERPTHLELIEVSSDKVTLRWQEGFNGGFANTEFLVTYFNTETGRSMNESCRSQNLCQITGLSANTEYHFKVIAVNPRGYSPYSEDLSVTTKDMPRPTEAQFDRDTGYLTFHVEPSSLKLLAKIEARPVGTEMWVQQTVISVIRQIEKVQLSPPDEGFSDVRVKLCLESNDSWCGDAKLANPLEEELPNPKDARAAISSETLMVIVGIIGVTFLICIVLIICCCWKKKVNHKEKKEFEMETQNPRPKAVTPPYFPDGVVNKGLESVTDDIHKAGIYTTNTSGINGGMNGHIPSSSHPHSGMMYNPDPDQSPCSALDHSEPWLKPTDDMGTEGSYQPYDSRLPNGYFYPEDYQPLTEEMMNMKNREHLHSPYYDVSGLPDPYAMSEEDKTQHISMSFDESHESGYSTPNSRSRRVIREIIV